MPILTKSLTLKDLPPAPRGKTGWPWTEENQLLPARMPDGSEWPCISVVTPCYNYGEFLEETIRSVLLQGYPNLEYIIIDGGSTDNTVEVIKKYEKYITYWVSESDEGQTDAINKGYQHCTGDIFVWLNGDDSYAKPSCLQEVADFYRLGYEFIAGSCVDIYANGEKTINHSHPTTFKRYLKFWISLCNYPQPSVFVSKRITDKCFPLNPELYILMDYQFFLRTLSKEPKSIYVNEIWTQCKKHGRNKTLLEYTEGFAEFRKVVIFESKALAKLERIKFLFDLEDYTVIYPLIKNLQQVTPAQVILALSSRPTILRWPCIWKILLKSTLGSNVYSKIKSLVGYS